jgi:hypothetical protein
VNFLSWLFVAKPLNILAVAAVFVAGYLALRFTPISTSRHPRPMLVAAIGWGLYAAWEWLVLIRTPEANIRVDLFIIWPALALLSAWALFRVMQKVNRGRS